MLYLHNFRRKLPVFKVSCQRKPRGRSCRKDRSRMHRHQQRNAADTKLTCTLWSQGSSSFFSPPVLSTRTHDRTYTRIGTAVLPIGPVHTGSKRNWPLETELGQPKLVRVNFSTYNLIRCILDRQIEESTGEGRSRGKGTRQR